MGHGESRGIWAMFEQLRQRIEAGDQDQCGLVVIGGLMIVISSLICPLGWTYPREF